MRKRLNPAPPGLSWHPPPLGAGADSAPGFSRTEGGREMGEVALERSHGDDSKTCFILLFF